jgi:predicted Zn-dependent protease
MLNSIIQSLRARTDLKEWSVRHLTTRGAQLYAVPAAVEAKRAVDGERYSINVLQHHSAEDGSITCGSGNATLLPGDDIDRAIDAAALIAGLVHNPVYTFPAPADLPEVPVADASFQANPSATLDELYTCLKQAVARHPQVRMTAAEVAGEEVTTHLLNSRGIDAIQVATQIDIEWVLIGRSGEQEVESFVELTRRRAADIDVAGEVDRRARYTVDLLAATTPPMYEGPIVLREATLAGFINSGDFTQGGPFQMLTSGSAKFSKITTWEIGQSVFRREVTGDPLTMWANRRLPYGTHANRFDEEGLPAQRIELIKNNQLLRFTASQRYADYLSLSPTGAFGDIEVVAGHIPAAELLAEPHIEIVSFSWFNPSPVTGDFASEIRLGYLVDGGRRTPFRGGMLVGNVFDALANVRWSSETGFYGDYLGPTTARFGQLKVAGADASA